MPIEKEASPMIDWENGFGYELKDTGEEGLITSYLYETRDREKFTFFDVGANRGDYTGFLLSVGRPNVDVHCFEISPVMQRRLKENFGHLPYVRVNPFGLGDAPGDYQYRRYISGEGLNTLQWEMEIWDQTIPSVIEECQIETGKRYCEAAEIDHIDLLKIDTEGWDWFVLQGFEPMISNKEIDLIQFEYGYANVQSRKLMLDFWAFFEARGYKLGRLRPTGVDWTDYQIQDNNFEGTQNWVAFSPAIF